MYENLWEKIIYSVHTITSESRFYLLIGYSATCIWNSSFKTGLVFLCHIVFSSCMSNDTCILSFTFNINIITSELQLMA